MTYKTSFSFLTVSIFILLSSCSNSKFLEGNWVGEGNQIDGKTWEVDLTYNSPLDIKINYPDLSCGGVWGIITETKKVSIFTEDIQFGKLKCDQGCEVHLSKIDENSVKLVYFLRYYDPVSPIAEAILTRTH